MRPPSSQGTEGIVSPANRRWTMSSASSKADGRVLMLALMAASRAMMPLGARLHSAGIRDRPITPRSPWQNGHVERLIGSIRRACLDHVVVLGERHLRHLLANYAAYYNGVRTHLALDKDTPLHRPAQTVGRIASVTWLGGLHRYYARTA